MNKYNILLFYKYVHINDAKKFAEQHKKYCASLNLKGRIIISEEGINGTVEGLSKDADIYIEHMHADTRFADIDFKKSEGNGDAFPKLSVKYRKEIVTLGTGTADLMGEFVTGKYIEPEELEKMYEQKEDFMVLDMRNNYECLVGKFEGSLCLPIQNFREIPEYIEKIKGSLMDKKIVSVCTGGVRCEKATQYLLKSGFSNVSQLHGGMVRYLEKFPNKNFKGSLYVFDKRVVVSYDNENGHEVIGVCQNCNQKTEKYINCKNIMCNKHILCCDECEFKGGFCSDICANQFITKRM